jgi:hypothetical protein
MKKYHALVALSLLLGLYIYTVYRSEQTVINVLLQQILSADFLLYKNKLRFFDAPPDWFLYNLPSSLWLFAATLLARNLYFRWLHLAILPFLYVVFLEFLQYKHCTNGTFDGLDIAFGFVFAFFAFCIKCPFLRQQCTEKPFWRIYFCFSAAVIVYLAEFWG